MSQHQPTQDQPYLGIMLMLGFCIIAPFGDAVVKLLGERVPLIQVLLVRFAVQAIILGAVVAMTGRRWRLHGKLWMLSWLRAVLHIAGIATIFVALRFLPIAEAIAIAYVMPFLMLLLGRYVLDEEIGARRMWACVVGFAGTLMVVQPTFAEVGWPALLPLGVAVIFAFFMLVTRQIARETDPIGLQAVNGVQAMILLVPLALILNMNGDAVFDMSAATSVDLTLLLAIGVSGTVAHLLMSWSLRYAPSATLAPMQYIEIPIATFYGWLIFSDLPNGLAAIGICVTMAAGLYIVMRERSMSRTPPIEQP